MTRAVLVVATLAALGGVASADTTQGTIASWLQEGYEIKAAFSDNNGGAYIVVQKGTSAFVCHSNPLPRCEKLN